MIFGFNSEIKLGEAAYHVQSEAREKDLLLQTQVFVKGRCVGKLNTSYAAHASEPGFSEQRMHEMLKQQHKAFVAAAREGRIEPLLRIDVRIEDAGGGGLALEWTNADSAVARDGTVRLLVTDGGQPVAGARIVARRALPGDTPSCADVLTDPSGTAEIRVAFDRGTSEEPCVFVRATHGVRSATRKFRLKKS